MAMIIVIVEIDLAKSVFALCGLDERGKAVMVLPAVRLDNCW